MSGSAARSLGGVEDRPSREGENVCLWEVVADLAELERQRQKPLELVPVVWPDANAAVYGIPVLLPHGESVLSEATYEGGDPL